MEAKKELYEQLKELELSLRKSSQKSEDLKELIKEKEAIIDIEKNKIKNSLIEILQDS